LGDERGGENFHSRTPPRSVIRGAIRKLILMLEPCESNSGRSLYYDRCVILL